MARSGCVNAVRRRPARAHAEYFLQLAERTESKLVESDQRTWLEQLDQEHDNLRTAAREFLNRHDVSGAERLFGALRNFWFYRGYLSEGRAWLAEALSVANDPSETTDVATQVGDAETACESPARGSNPGICTERFCGRTFDGRGRA